MTIEQAPCIPREVSTLLATELHTIESNLVVEEVTEQYPWIRGHSLYLGMSTSTVNQGATFTVARSGRAPPFALGGPSGLSNLSTLLIRERSAIPGGLDACELAEAIRRLFVAPRGLVGEPSMLDEMPIPASEVWCDGDPEEQRRSRGRMCLAPVLHEHAGAWELRFFFWNPAGGVELWNVAGDASHIVSVREDIAAPDGSFRWPWC